MTIAEDRETWRDNLVTTGDGIRRMLENAKRIAVLGIKREYDRPAYFVPEYAQMAGYEIIPVPVYYPELKELMGQPVYRRVVDVPGEVDIVNVFRRSHDIPPHVDDIIAKKPKAVWFQLGIRHDAAARRLAEAGIEVVQDRCTMVDHQMAR
jgi:predicted CoA-binding protein